MKILAVPFGAGGLGRGNASRDAPKEILAALPPEKYELLLVPVNENDHSASHALIETCVATLSDPAIILGGDHSITYAAVKGFAQNKKDFLLVVFDAHPDVTDDFSPPTHEDYLRVLVEEKIVCPENILLLGVRNEDAIETAYLAEEGIRCVRMDELKEKGLLAVLESELNKKDSVLPIYFSLDIDVFDPAEAPGTGYAEPDGLSFAEFFAAFQNIKSRIAMLDIVEVAPEKDVDGKTVQLAVKVVEEFAT